MSARLIFTNRRSHVRVRSILPLALFVLFPACSPEAPERSSESRSADAGIVNTESIASAQMRKEVAAQDSTESREPSRELLTPNGWGPLRIGMSRAQVVLAAGEDAQPGTVGGPDPDACDEFRPQRTPAGVLVMIENGVLTRISVSKNSEISTPVGIRVGDSGSTVLAKYGARARVEPHKYWEPPAKYVTVQRPASSEAARRGIRYEINADGEVVHLRAGGPSIEYVEGCL